MLGVGLVAACVGCVAAPPTAEELLALGDPPPCGVVSEDVELGEAPGCWKATTEGDAFLTTAGVSSACEASAACVVLGPGETTLRKWFEPLAKSPVPIVVEVVPCDATCH